MLSSRAIALHGVGYSPAVMALQGMLAVEDQPSVAPITGGSWVDGKRLRKTENDDVLLLLLM